MNVLTPVKFPVGCVGGIDIPQLSVALAGTEDAAEMGYAPSY